MVRVCFWKHFCCLLFIKNNSLQLAFACIKGYEVDYLLQQRTFVGWRSSTLYHVCSSSPNNINIYPQDELGNPGTGKVGRQHHISKAAFQ